MFMPCHQVLSRRYLKSLALVYGVSQLREGVCVFSAVDEDLETLCEALLRIILSSG
jgi:hypothetical protein